MGRDQLAKQLALSLHDYKRACEAYAVNPTPEGDGRCGIAGAVLNAMFEAGHADTLRGIFEEPSVPTTPKTSWRETSTCTSTTTARFALPMAG